MQVQTIEGVGCYLLIATGLIGLYFWILQRCGLLKIKAASLGNVPVTPATISDIIPKQGLLASKGLGSMTLPPEADAIIGSDPEDDESFEFLEEDNGSLLLKEAERVIEKVQDQISHIASNPPNPEEVTSKIRAVVNPYQLFNDTEYYGAINAYIALAVERDLGITLSNEEIKALWN